jgi:predicted transcriptional regulator
MYDSDSYLIKNELKCIFRLQKLPPSLFQPPFLQFFLNNFNKTIDSSITGTQEVISRIAENSSSTFFHTKKSKLSDNV